MTLSNVYKNKKFTTNFSFKCPTDCHSTMRIVEITNLRKRLQSMWVCLDCVASYTSLSIITPTDAFGKFYTKCSICVLLIWLTVGTFCKLGRTQRQGIYSKKNFCFNFSRGSFSLPFCFLSSIKRTMMVESFTVLYIFWWLIVKMFHVYVIFFCWYTAQVRS